ncbi:toll/interleukin-1 receptor domain-containing protein [Kitasatospora sp. NPDC056327]|uniref:toll/interleukin-1 receptor domain-containing protein n=1 Tax=Kitasatospora sp. NPDC056327 TaxID=3345785 RepID=UPI0035D6CB77
MKPRIFISHGAGRDPEVRQVLTLLEPSLTERGYSVFVDAEGLRVGDNWNQRLYDEMFGCDAAIVLLGPNTVGMAAPAGTSEDTAGSTTTGPASREISWWVLRESEVLVARHRAGSLPTVLPGLVGKVTTSAARKNGFASIMSLQAAKSANSLAEEAGSSPDDVAKRILEEIAPIRATIDGAGNWAQRIADFLRTARSVNGESYVAAAQEAGLPDDELFHIRSMIGSELFLAHRLLSGELHQKLPGMIARLRPNLDSDNLRHLADEILPAWVNDQAARMLAPGGHDSVPRPRTAPDQPEPESDTCTGTDMAGPARIVLMDVTMAWTAEQYVQRSVHNEPAAYSLHSVPEDIPTDDSPVAEALEALCRTMLRRVFSVPSWMPVNAETVRPDPGVRNYLVLHARELTTEDLTAVTGALHRDFPWLVVIALTGRNEGAEPFRVADSPSVLTVRPALSLADEQRARRLKHRIDEVIAPRNAYSWFN